MIELNIDKLLEQKGKSRYWLFNQLNSIKNISYSNFLNLIDNRTKSIKYENIEKLCTILECEPNDLFIIKH
jgi:putative transcriptional regulator